MYTCLFESHHEDIKNTCFDPLFYYYPYDDNLYQNYEEQFMVGGAIKVAPILVPNITDTYPVYFPNGTWVNLADYSEIVKGPGYTNITAKKKVNAHLRPGSMIPFQDNSKHNLKNTAQLVEAPITIIANRDESGEAKGSLFLDGGKAQKQLHYN